MTTENLIQLVISIVGIATAVISASLAYLFAKKSQIVADENRLKEKCYLNYIEAVSDIVISNNAEDARDKLADAQNQLLLVGSAQVVEDLMNFFDYIKPSNQKKIGPDKHDELLTKLIKSMRLDLYKSRKVNVNYPIIHLSGKAPID